MNRERILRHVDVVLDYVALAVLVAVIFVTVWGVLARSAFFYPSAGHGTGSAAVGDYEGEV